MKILLAVATRAEIQPFIDFSGLTESHPITWGEKQISILFTGVGIASASFNMGRHLATNNYDLIINPGIAGAIDRDLEIGEVVSVKSDEFYLLGSEGETNFNSVFDLGFVDPNSIPFKNGYLHAPTDTFSVNLFSQLKKVHAITVQTVHGKKDSIHVLRNNNPTAQIESQEGAAVMFSAGIIGIPCIQIRGISNYVEPRNTLAWNIPLAVNKLNQTLIQTLKPSKEPLVETKPI